MSETSLSDQLCNASARGNLSEVQFLLQNGAHVNGYNKYKRTALQVVKLGAAAVVLALLEAGAQPNLPDPACGRTVLHDAAEAGFGHTVAVLLQHGADADLADDKGNLPLHLAAKQGHLEAVRVILGRTANPRAVNHDGHSAEQLAGGALRAAIRQHLHACES